MKRIFSMAAAVGLLVVSWNTTTTHAAPITVSGVTASSEITEGPGPPHNRNPGNLIDGSGLTAGLHDFATSNQWLSSSDGNAGWGGIDNDPWVLFDLGAVYTVDNMKVWNFSEGDWSVGRGVDDVSVEYGTTAALGSTVPGLTNFDIAPPAGGGGVAGTDYNLGGITAQFIKFDIDSHHPGGDNNFYGLNEVQFDGELFTGGGGGPVVPEPASIAIWSLIGLCLAGYGYRRRRNS